MINQIIKFDWALMQLSIANWLFANFKSLNLKMNKMNKLSQNYSWYVMCSVDHGPQNIPNITFHQRPLNLY